MVFSSANDYSRMKAVKIDESYDYSAIMAYFKDTNNWFKRFKGEWKEDIMEIKKHAIVGCEFTHNGIMHNTFQQGCHQCLVASVIELCEILEEHPDVAKTDPSATSNGLTEVFNGTHVTHVTKGRITNVVALPMTPADLEEGIVRYTVEFRKDVNITKVEE